MNHRRYIWFTVYWVIPFNRTGYICNVAGGNSRPYIRNPFALIIAEMFHAVPHSPHQSRPGKPASPKGSFCTVFDGTPFILTRFYPEGPRNGSGRSLRFRWLVYF